MSGIFVNRLVSFGLMSKLWPVTDRHTAYGWWDGEKPIILTVHPDSVAISEGMNGETKWTHPLDTRKDWNTITDTIANWETVKSPTLSAYRLSQYCRMLESEGDAASVRAIRRLFSEKTADIEHKLRKFREYGPWVFEFNRVINAEEMANQFRGDTSPHRPGVVYVKPNELASRERLDEFFARGPRPQVFNDVPFACWSLNRHVS